MSQEILIGNIKGEKGDKCEVDQTYNSKSENAQSGKALEPKFNGLWSVVNRQTESIDSLQPLKVTITAETAGSNGYVSDTTPDEIFDAYIQGQHVYAVWDNVYYSLSQVWPDRSMFCNVFTEIGADGRTTANLVCIQIDEDCVISIDFIEIGKA